MPKKPLTDKIDLDQLAKMFDLPSFDEIDELNMHHVFEIGTHAYRNSLEDARRWTDEEDFDEADAEADAEKEREKAETEARDEVFHNWKGAVLSASEALFARHGLTLDPVRKSGWDFKIVPEVSWDSAADAIRETINGVGDFHFYDLDEFLDSGPYTPRQAVLSHLGYIRRYPDVYGSMSAQRYYEQAWR